MQSRGWLDDWYYLGATENASTENESTGGWNMQVAYGKRKYESATVENVSTAT